MPNRLADATSPYLRQHAANPVEWWPWCDEAFAEARERDVPVLVSVGYSACHWCHVMAHESFEDAAIAEAMNAQFVCVKVDREERPDVDSVLMQATVALTGQGGWPMHVFVTPDGHPFFAGTYFPPERRGGMPSFREVVDALGEAWRERRDEVLGSADAIVAQLATLNPVENAAAPRVADVLERLSEGFDALHGGFGGAPKFPPFMVLDALLVKGDPASLDMAQRTLELMARGGIHDQVGGGFHRYSVDAHWVVPHFEKMLYDNALGLGTYVRCWRRTPDHDAGLRGLFERVAYGIVEWLERDMLLESGGFAASMDADSTDIRGMVAEGIYYVWSPDLLVDALGDEDGDWAADVFHVTNAGTFEHGLSTLQLRGNPDPARLASVLQRLRDERAARFAPARDDKLVASWNGWLIDSLVQGGAVFGERGWLDLARGAAEALWNTHWVDGRLRRTSLDGVAGDGLGTAEDYGAVALGFARLGGALGEPVWLERARELLAVAVDEFEAEDGGFYDAVAADALYARPRDLADNATPSGTAALVAALRLVGLLAEDEQLLARARVAAATTYALVTSSPRFAGAHLADLMVADEARRGLAPATVVVVDEAADPLSRMAQAAWRMAPAGSAVVVARPGAEGWGSLFLDRPARDGQPTAYVCRGTVCLEPVTAWAELKTPLWTRV